MLTPTGRLSHQLSCAKEPILAPRQIVLIFCERAHHRLR